MAALAVGTEVVSRKMQGLAWGRVAMFAVPDMVIWIAANYLFYRVMPLPSVLFRSLQLFVIDTISILAGVYLNRYLLGKKNGIQWTQALTIHAASLLAIVFWIYCLKLPTPY